MLRPRAFYASILNLASQIVLEWLHQGCHDFVVLIIFPLRHWRFLVKKCLKFVLFVLWRRGNEAIRVAIVVLWCSMIFCNSVCRSQCGCNKVLGCCGCVLRSLKEKRRVINLFWQWVKVKSDEKSLEESWEEAGRGGKRWEDWGGKSWEKVRRCENEKRWGEESWEERADVRRVKNSQEKLRKGGKRWQEVATRKGYKSWAELRRGEKSWGRCEKRWEELRRGDKSKERWEELRRVRRIERWFEKSWVESKWFFKKTENILSFSTS